MRNCGNARHFSLCLVIQTADGITDLVTVLQMQKEDEMRIFDMEKARSTQSEIDEVRDQIEKEERYTLIKCVGQTKREELNEKKIKGILKVTSNKHSDSPVSVLL